MKRFLLMIGGLLLALPAQTFAEAKVDFVKQIRPIFHDNCYKCHSASAKKLKGGFRMDSVELFRKGGKDAAEKVLIPGSPDKSDVYHRMTLPKDDDDVMPPDGKGDHLTKEQTDLIKAWISQGADFGKWKEDSLKDSATSDAGTGDKTDTTTSADEGPKEIPLPQVAAADAGALDKLRQAGALALPLAQGTNLLSVEFTSNAGTTTDQQIALLQPLAIQIYDLNLANTKVTDAGLAVLDGMKNLHRLHLEKTAITDSGLVHLKGLTALEYVNLYSTGVTDAGLVDLAALKGLKNLYLWQSKVTDAGADSLKKSLPSVAVDLGWKEPTTAAATLPSVATPK